MISFGPNRVLVLVGIILLSTSLTTGKTRKMQRLTTGTWGGMHVLMEVKEQSATVAYDCANGEVEGPLTVEKNGRFNWHGKHHVEHGGPVRRDEEGNEIPVVYTGTLLQGQMTLTVKRADTGAVIGTYTLKHGSMGRVMKCK